jgi:chromosome segregation ATPase
MSDNGQNSGGGNKTQQALGKVLGLRAKAAQTLPPITDEELHDEAIVRALSGSHALRNDMKMYKQRAEQFEEELNTRTHEFESKLVALKTENNMLREKLHDTGARMEHYQKEALALLTKADDIEMFFISEMGRMVELANQSANQLISGINGSAGTMRKFLDDLHEKRKGGEYAKARDVPKPHFALDPEEEKILKDLAPKFGPKETYKPSQQDAPPIAPTSEEP